jgi:hypothetical protein
MTSRGRRSNDNVIRVPRVVKSGPYSAVEIWPPNEDGVAETRFISFDRPVRPVGQKETPRTMRPAARSAILALAQRMARAVFGWLRRAEERRRRL